MADRYNTEDPDDLDDLDFLELDDWKDQRDTSDGAGSGNDGYGSRRSTGSEKYEKGRMGAARERSRRTSENRQRKDPASDRPGSSGQNRNRQSGSRQSRDGQKNRHGNGRRKINPALPVILGIILLILVIAGRSVYQIKYGYSTERADLNSYFGLSSEDDVAVVCNQALSDTHAKLIDGEVYLDLDTVQQDLNPRFYWGITDNIVIYCLPTEMVQTTVGSKEWSSDSSGAVTENYAPAVLGSDGKTLYLALDFVKQYTNFAYQYYSDPNRIVLTTTWGDRSAATVTGDTEVRVSGGVKSEILTDAAKGDEVTVLNAMDTWSQVETADGFIGYVENRKLSDPQTVTDTPVTDYTEPEFTTVKLDGLVNMGWHNVTNTDATDLTFDSATANVKDLNVIAPTWFPVKDDSGDLDNYASASYVEKAHANGWKVWAVVDNFQIEGVDHNNCIALLERRQNIISQLMNFADQYGFDGINVDFEQVDSAYGQDFIEFVRELSIACRKKGLTLSVDNYVTYDFNDYYHMDEQGVFADYVCIMGYDEHYAGSSEAGSVASIDYVKYGIERALQEVPADKLVNGIPFYTRLWITDSTGTMTSQTLDMQTAQQFLTEHGQSASWDDKTQQNVADFEEDGTHYQIWLEDAESIRSKLGVMKADGIAGVAEWKLGQETADVWDVIASYVEGTLN